LGIYLLSFSWWKSGHCFHLSFQNFSIFSGEILHIGDWCPIIFRMVLFLASLRSLKFSDISFVFFHMFLHTLLYFFYSFILFISIYLWFRFNLISVCANKTE
jgi:hypothetical protein